MSATDDERPRPPILSPANLRHLARQLRNLDARQRTQPFERTVRPEVLEHIVNALEECARLRAAPGREREALLEQRAEGLALLATARRLPLAAVEGAVRRAEAAGRDSIPVQEIRRALARTEDAA